MYYHASFLLLICQGYNTLKNTNQLQKSLICGLASRGWRLLTLTIFTTSNFMNRISVSKTVYETFLYFVNLLTRLFNAYLTISHMMGYAK